MSVTRRQFLGASAAAMVAAGTMGARRAHGANDRIRVAVIGLNGQGGSHLGEFLDRSEEVDVVALCDVDSDVLARRVAQAKEKSGKEPKAYSDMRQLFEDGGVDAVTIATPNHWHSLAAIWACQAGMDVYVEKPLSHNIYEGRQLVAAAAKYGRIVQHGTQSRSNPTLMRDLRLIHEGFIGDIVHSRGYVYKTGNRASIGHGSPAEPPANLNWDLWQGPAQEKPYLAREDGSGLQVHYNWHWFWDYGNGEIGNQGVHEMDLAVWGHNRGLPVKVYSTGGRYGWDDQGETPNTQATSFTYADGTIVTFEVRNLGSFHEGGGGSCGNSYFGTKGYYVRDAGFFGYDNKPIEVDEPLPESLGRFGTFLKAVRSRKQEDVSAPVEAGHLACVHIHMGNAAYRLGRQLAFDPETERFVGDDEANALASRAYREGFAVPQIA